MMPSRFSIKFVTAQPKGFDLELVQAMLTGAVLVLVLFS